MKNPSAIGTTDDNGLRLERLSKNFGEFIAVDDVNLHIRRGEFLTILGPSGSGKTTLLMIIAGFLEATTGDIQFDGLSIMSLRPEKRNFGMVFQGYALFPHMTVRQNIAYPLEVRKGDRDEIVKRVDEMLELVQLETFGDRLPRQLSGGQQQRVALARALIFDPLVLLLDEPLGALDKKLRSNVQTQLKHLHRKVGKTFVYVTHDQEEALSMSDRVVIMNHGRVVQVGSPQELYERPSTVFASKFIGKSNILRGVVNQVDGNEVLYAIADKYFQQLVSNEKFSKNDEIILALRPEKIKIARSKVASNEVNILVGRIIDITYFGSTILVNVETDSVGEFIVEVQAWNNQETLEEGQNISLTWSPDAAFTVKNIESSFKEKKSFANLIST
ncbi:ABC transporter ATP-binding protein [Deltaproteobacteria bacterium]|nr:ABC transporter ATP-binding protein [Deltaproteobacteria bacterium]